jgi:hypothetical protein
MKSYSILVSLIIALLAGTAANAKYSGGTGEPNDPYRIATAENLNDIGNHQEDWDKHFVLVNDVNLAQYTGTRFKIIGNSTTNFTGVFDGNDHRVWSFTWSSTSRNFIGLFGYLSNGGQVKNLGMENVDVNAVNGYDVGGLVGYNSGTIMDCYLTGSVTGYLEVGGLVGMNSGTVTACYATGDVNGSDLCVGGLVGVNGGTISDCYSTGSVKGGNFVGGLVGENYEGTITNCYSTGSVLGGEDVGGLVGTNLSFGWSVQITNCYSTGSVTGNINVGGLVGVNWSFGWLVQITNCYSTGSVSGTNSVGGLVGQNGERLIPPGGHQEQDMPGWIYKCYSTGRVTGSSNVGGLVGHHIAGEVGDSFWDVNTSGQPNSAGGMPKTTTEIKTKSTFTNAGWDFVEVWGIGEGQTYPFLRTESAGDSNYDKKVDLADLAILASHWLEGPP